VLHRRRGDLGPNAPQLLGDLGVELVVVEEVVVGAARLRVRLGDVLARRCPKPTHAGNLGSSKKLWEVVQHPTGRVRSPRWTAGPTRPGRRFALRSGAPSPGPSRIVRSPLRT